MGPDTVPGQRLQKIGHANVLVECFRRPLDGRAMRATTRGSGGGRQLVVDKTLRWNSGRQAQNIRWKEAEAKRMKYENTQWRRKLILDTVARSRGFMLLGEEERVRRFGTSSTVFVTVPGDTSSLERTASHTRTKASTSAKVATRKINGGRIRGMKVLAYMNTARWNTMSTADREEAVQCPCRGGTQHVEHVMSECEYMLPHLDEMIQTVGEALQSEQEAAQSRWLQAQNVGEKVAVAVGMDVTRLSPEALREVAASLKLLVRRTERELRMLNTVGESWPVDALEVWAPEGEGPQIEFDEFDGALATGG